MVKDVKYIYNVKKDLFRCLRIEKERGDGNETSLKEGGGIKIKTTVLPLRDARSLRLKYSPTHL